MIQAKRIRTTAWEEEDFYLVTDLSDEQISKVMKKMVADERGPKGKFYDFDDYADRLRKTYKDSIVILQSEVRVLVY